MRPVRFTGSNLVSDLYTDKPLALNFDTTLDILRAILHTETGTEQGTAGSGDPSQKPLTDWWSSLLS